MTVFLKHPKWEVASLQECRIKDSEGGFYLTISKATN